MEQKKDKQTKEEENFFTLLVVLIRKDLFMYTIIIISLIICSYIGYYSMNYDKKIQEYYKTYIEENCYNMNGNKVFTRPEPFTFKALSGEVIIKDETQNTNKNN